MDRQRWLVHGAFAGLVGAAALAQVAAMSEDPARSGAGVSLVLHGNTPSLSWSPDSARVVVNASYTYFGSDEAIAQHQDSLGVWVVDAGTGASTRVGTDQGYHPLWLDAKTVAWGHSAYEAGTAGIYRSPADHSEITRVGTVQGVNHTLPAKDGNILYYSGFPEATGWTSIDVQSGQILRQYELAQDSWTRPVEQTIDQCPQRVGAVALSKGFEKGKQRIFVTREGKKRALGGVPYQYGVGDEWLPDAHKGLVRACLSPDGKRVAWFIAAGDGEYALRIGALPTQ